jgi:predicted DsbA family dithiol-disulfide isomerase
MMPLALEHGCVEGLTERAGWTMWLPHVRVRPATSTAGGRLGMAGAGALLASLVPVVVGLTTSAILAVDYLRDEPVFCAEGGGCSALRHSVVAGALGVPLPLAGLAGFLAVGIASLVPWPPCALGAARVLDRGRHGGALVALRPVEARGLLRLLLRYGRLRPRRSRGGRLEGQPLRRRAAPRWITVAGAVSLVGFVAGPLIIGARKEATYETPAPILAEIERTAPTKVTVVDFVDFECPFCRMTHALFAPLLAARSERVRCVRRQVPLHSHPHAQDAARAACCGETLGKGDEIADALFSAPVEELTPAGCEKIAEAHGLPLDSYRACVADPKTDERIEVDRAAFKASGGYALPTIWIDHRRLVGAQPPEALSGALDAALARH